MSDSKFLPGYVHRLEITAGRVACKFFERERYANEPRLCNTRSRCCLSLLRFVGKLTGERDDFFAAFLLGDGVARSWTFCWLMVVAELLHNFVAMFLTTGCG